MSFQSIKVSICYSVSSISPSPQAKNNSYNTIFLGCRIEPTVCLSLFHLPSLHPCFRQCCVFCPSWLPPRSLPSLVSYPWGRYSTQPLSNTPNVSYFARVVWWSSPGLGIKSKLLHWCLGLLGSDLEPTTQHSPQMPFVLHPNPPLLITLPVSKMPFLMPWKCGNHQHSANRRTTS